MPLLTVFHKDEEANNLPPKAWDVEVVGLGEALTARLGSTTVGRLGDTVVVGLGETLTARLGGTLFFVGLGETLTARLGGTLFFVGLGETLTARTSDPVFVGLAATLSVGDGSRP